MKPRTFVAVQFGLWAFFFGEIVPFGGSFLLPIIWIYDRRIFWGLISIQLIELARFFPGTINVIPPNLLKDLPSGWLVWILPLSLLVTAISMTSQTWIGAWFIRRKMKKLAPDLKRVLP